MILTALEANYTYFTVIPNELSYQIFLQSIPILQVGKWNKKSNPADQLLFELPPSQKDCKTFVYLQHANFSFLEGRQRGQAWPLRIICSVAYRAEHGIDPKF